MALDAASADRGDGIDLLQADHRQIEVLLARLSKDGAAAPREVLDDLTPTLAVHSAIEIEYLYPLVQKHLQGGSNFARQGRLDHEEIDMTLYRLQHLSMSEREFGAELAKLAGDVAEHLRGEEELVFPPLRAALGPEELAKLARHLEEAKRHAPTHPHPSAPKSAWGSRLAHRLVGVVDRMSDRRRQG